MVQFGSRLESNRVPEWSDYYLDYEKLKKTIKNVARKVGSVKQVDVDQEQITVSPTTEMSALLKTKMSLRQFKGNGFSDLDETGEFKSPQITPTKNVKTTTTPMTKYGAIDAVADLALDIEEMDDPDEEYVQLSEEESKKVEKFYQEKVLELKGRIDHVQNSLIRLKKRVRKKSVVVESDEDLSEHAVDLDSMDADTFDDNVQLPRDVLTTESLNRSCVDIFKQLNLLQNFAVINYTGFVKISKKHDKITGLKTSQKMLHKISKCGFSTRIEVNNLTQRFEKFYAKGFHAGDLTAAKGELLMKHRPASDWEMLRIGMRVGQFFTLFIWLLWDLIVVGFASDKPINQVPPQVLQVYRGIASFSFCFWLWAFALYIWGNARVNYVYLFEVDVRLAIHPMQILLKATAVTNAFLINFILYLKIFRGSFYFISPNYAAVLPFLGFFFLLGEIFLPWTERSGFFVAVWATMTAPFGEVTFFTSFVGDVLTSLVKPLVDVVFSLCFFISGDWRALLTIEPLSDSHQSLLLPNTSPPPHNPLTQQSSTGYNNNNNNDGTLCLSSPIFNQAVIPIVLSLPYWWRLMQNLKRYYETRKRFPYLANAVKYALAFVVVLLGALHPIYVVNSLIKPDEFKAYTILWVSIAIISTLYAFIWDVYVDWGLGNRDSKFLRVNTMYTTVWWYYAAIAVDLLLRFAWVLTLMPNISNFVVFKNISSGFLTLAVSTMELSRRCIWSLFRVENEHLYNTEGYRRVDFIPLHLETSLEETPQDLAKVSYRKKIAVFLEMFVFICIVVTIAVLAFSVPTL